jgi:hypothetical protein
MNIHNFVVIILTSIALIAKILANLFYKLLYKSIKNLLMDQMTNAARKKNLI